MSDEIVNFINSTFKNSSTKTSAGLHRSLASYMSSIGQISCGRPIGTCWLVADMLVITNHHIYIYINKEREKLQNPELPITISFDYFYRGKTEDVVTVEVDEERDPEIGNLHLDYKFLRLKKNESLRHRIPLGSIVRNRPLQEGLVIILGYPRGEEMQEETCTVLSKSSRLEKLSQRFQACTGLELPYLCERYQFCLAYDTSLFRGTSGSPVFDMNGNIVALHTKGYVIDVEEVTYSLMEFGVEFGAICEDIRRRYHAAEELFPNCQLGFDEELMDIDGEFYFSSIVCLIIVMYIFLHR